MDINDVLPPEANLQKYADDILTYIIGDKALENLIYFLDLNITKNIINKFEFNLYMLALKSKIRYCSQSLVKVQNKIIYQFF